MSLRATARRRLISNTVDDTFGPNSCTTLRLRNKVTGDLFDTTCDRKRCVDCGPRKKMTIQLQMEAGFGDEAWVAHTNDHAALIRSLELAKKRKKRYGIEYTYQIVGDQSLGWIVCSNIQLIPEQRKTYLQQWLTRILDLYHHSVQRIRRSFSLGRLSLVPLRSSKRKWGQGSNWEADTADSALVAEGVDLDWSDLLAELEHKHGVHE